MILIWAGFTLMLFVLEPLWLHRWFLKRAERDQEGTFRIIEWLHRVLLLLSVITVGGAAAGSHG